jgi:hypothetical protein
VRIKGTCSYHGLVVSAPTWSRAATETAIHGLGCTVTLYASLTRQEWAKLPRDYKLTGSKQGTLAGQPRQGRAILHRDSDGATILVPARIEESPPHTPACTVANDRSAREVCIC